MVFKTCRSELGLNFGISLNKKKLVFSNKERINIKVTFKNLLNEMQQHQLDFNRIFYHEFSFLDVPMVSKFLLLLKKNL